MNLEQIQEEQQEGSENHQDSSDDDDQSCSDSSNKLIVKSRNAHKVKYSTCEDGVGKDATNKDNQSKQS